MGLEQARLDAAKIGAGAKKDVAVERADAQRDVAGTRADAYRYGAELGLKGKMYGAEKTLEGVLHRADNILKGQTYSADQRLRGVESTNQSRERIAEGRNKVRETISKMTGLGPGKQNNGVMKAINDLETTRAKILARTIPKVDDRSGRIRAVMQDTRKAGQPLTPKQAGDYVDKVAEKKHKQYIQDAVAQIDARLNELRGMTGPTIGPAGTEDRGDEWTSTPIF